MLKVRQHQILVAKHELSGAQMLLAQAWAKMEQARLSRTQFETELEERRRQRMTAHQWAASDEQLGALVQAEKAAAQQVHEALAVVAQKRADLEEAERRCKTLENLRDQQFEAHRYAEGAEEQNLLDEMAQVSRQGGKEADRQ